MKTIKQLVDELRDIDYEPTRQQQMGVIRYLQQLRVGSIVDTPDGRGVVIEPYGTDVWYVWLSERCNAVVDYDTDDLEVIG